MEFKHCKPSRNAAQGNFRLGFLNSNFLEVHKFGLVDIQNEPSSVLTLRVSANSRLSVLELLLYVANHTITVTAFETSSNQLRMHRMSSREKNSNIFFTQEFSKHIKYL